MLGIHREQFDLPRLQRSVQPRYVAVLEPVRRLELGHSRKFIGCHLPVKSLGRNGLQAVLGLHPRPPRGVLETRGVAVLSPLGHNVPP